MPACLPDAGLWCFKYVEQLNYLEQLREATK